MICTCICCWLNSITVDSTVSSISGVDIVSYTASSYYSKSSDILISVDIVFIYILHILSIIVSNVFLFFSYILSCDSDVCGVCDVWCGKNFTFSLRTYWVILFTFLLYVPITRSVTYVLNIFNTNCTACTDIDLICYPPPQSMKCLHFIRVFVIGCML